jgi:predicted aspartyl protease
MSSGDARPAALKDLTIEIKKPLGPIMVPVQLGEFPSMQFMLDTGFSVTGVNSRHASRLGQQLSSKVIGTHYGRRTVERYRSPPLSIGGVPTSSEGIMLSTDLSWFEKKLGVDIDGCVGFDALRSSIVQFDWTSGCVRFLAAVPDDPGIGLPIRISAIGVPMVQCAVGSLPEEWFIIDTGFCGEIGIIVPQTVVEQLKEAGEFTGGGKTFNPEYPEWSSDTGTVASITLGTFHDQNLNMMSGEWHALGLGYLSRFTMTLDIPGRVLYLKRRKSP